MIAASQELTIEGLPVLSPRPLREACERYKWPIWWTDRCNSIEACRGHKPGQAWLLMRRSDAKKLDKMKALAITWDVEGGKKLEFKGWFFVEATALNRADKDDDDAAVVVRLEDVRRLMDVPVFEASGSFSFASAVNAGVRRASGEYYLASAGDETKHKFGKLHDTLIPFVGRAQEGTEDAFNGAIAYDDAWGRDAGRTHFAGQSAWRVACACASQIQHSHWFDPLRAKVVAIDRAADGERKKLPKKAKTTWQAGATNGDAGEVPERIRVLSAIDDVLDADGTSVNFGSAAGSALAIAFNDLDVWLTATGGWQSTYMRGVQDAAIGGWDVTEEELPELADGLGVASVITDGPFVYRYSETGYEPTAGTKAWVLDVARRWLTRRIRDNAKDSATLIGLWDVACDAHVARVRWRDIGGGPETVIDYGPDPDEHTAPRLIAVGRPGRHVWQVAPSPGDPLVITDIGQGRVDIVGNVGEPEAAGASLWSMQWLSTTHYIPPGTTLPQIEIPAGGIYSLAFHGTLEASADDVPSGTDLTVMVVADNATGARWLHVPMTRRHIVYADGYGDNIASAENVACSVVVRLSEGDKVGLLNVTDYPASMTHGRLTITRVDLQ